MKNNKGFSLVELIVVIAIMAILAAVAIPTFASFITKANKASDESYMNDIKYAVELALAEEGGVPAGHEIRVTITSAGDFDYAVVKIADASAIDFDTADVEAVLADNYQAKGLEKGKTYHKDGDHWEVCDCETDSTPTDPEQTPAT